MERLSQQAIGDALGIPRHKVMGTFDHRNGVHPWMVLSIMQVEAITLVCEEGENVGKHLCVQGPLLKWTVYDFEATQFENADVALTRWTGKEKVRAERWPDHVAFRARDIETNLVHTKLDERQKHLRSQWESKETFQIIKDLALVDEHHRGIYARARHISFAITDALKAAIPEADESKCEALMLADGRKMVADLSPSGQRTNLRESFIWPQYVYTKAGVLIADVSGMLRHHEAAAKTALSGLGHKAVDRAAIDALKAKKLIPSRDHTVHHLRALAERTGQAPADVAVT